MLFFSSCLFSVWGPDGSRSSKGSLVSVFQLLLTVNLRIFEMAKQVFFGSSACYQHNMF